MKKFLLSAALSATAAICLNAATVATVDGSNIDDSEVIALLSAGMPGFDPSQYAQIPADIKKRVIDDLINRRLIINDAKATGIDKDAEYLKSLEQVKEGVMVEVYMKKIYDAIKASDAEIKKFYDENKDRFNQPAQARAKHILLADEKAANAVIAQLKGLKGDALVKKFEEIAKAQSIDKGSAVNGGELGWFGQSQMVKPFADAVFGMSKGEVSAKPVKSNFGYHVILKEDSKAAGVVSLEQAKPQIEQAVKMEKFQTTIRSKGDNLRSKAKIEYK